MRAILAVALAGGLFLAGAPARAETWRVLDGRVTDAATGRHHPLSGWLQGSEFEPDPPDGASPVVLSLDDFALAAGGLQLVPRQDVEYQGQRPIPWLQIGDAILIEGEQVSFLRLRAGGELVAASEGEATFRFLDLRADASNGGRAIGLLGDGALPRRLELAGALYEVLQSFELPGTECEAPPPGDGGVVIGGGGAILSYESFDIGDSGDVTLFQPPADTGGVLNRVTGGSSSIGGELRIGGSLYMLNPAGVALSPAGVVSSSSFVALPSSSAPQSTPTLEELGMRAPDGAEVSLDAAGALEVRSLGDLFVEGVFPEIPGLTSVTLSSPSRIVITGSLELPAGVSLRVEAERIEWSGGVPAPDPDPDFLPGPEVPICRGLLPILPAEERAIGTFSLVATAAQPVEIEVQPGSGRKPLRPGSRQVIPVALLGSRELDVRDVDPRSLRLGDGEAEPLAARGRPLTLRMRVNRDRHADLLAFFRVRDAELAEGDSELCLLAEMHDGTLLEGCDSARVRRSR